MALKQRDELSRVWVMVLVAAMIAGLSGFGIGEAAPKLVPPALNLPPEIMKSSSAKPLEIERRMRISRDRAATIAYGGLGAILGLAVGLCSGVARRSPRAAVAAGVIGLVLGGAAGTGATMGILPTYHAARLATADEDMTKDLALALRTHGAIWLSIGAAAGLALGIGLGGGSRILRALFGGILGAAIGTVVYEFVGAIAFPMSETFRPMAVTMAPRLVAHASVAIFSALVACWAVYNLVVSRRASAPSLE
jgi:hypothetical protein